jgi:hypothetical protein
MRQALRVSGAVMYTMPMEHVPMTAMLDAPANGGVTL